MGINHEGRIIGIRHEVIDAIIHLGDIVAATLVQSVQIYNQWQRLLTLFIALRLEQTVAEAVFFAHSENHGRCRDKVGFQV